MAGAGDVPALVLRDVAVLMRRPVKFDYVGDMHGPTHEHVEPLPQDAVHTYNLPCCEFASLSDRYFCCQCHHIWL